VTSNSPPRFTAAVNEYCRPQTAGCHRHVSSAVASMRTTALVVIAVLQASALERLPAVPENSTEAAVVPGIPDSRSGWTTSLLRSSMWPWPTMSASATRACTQGFRSTRCPRYSFSRFPAAETTVHLAQGFYADGPRAAAARSRSHRCAVAPAPRAPAILMPW
jgi:hypothetical protein